MQIRRPPWIGMCRGCSIQLGLEPAGHRLIGAVIRTTNPGRRHGAASKLDDNFFPGLRRIPDPIRIRLVEYEVRCFQPFVVTRDAVFRDEVTRWRRTRRRDRCPRFLRSACVDKRRGSGDNRGQPHHTRESRHTASLHSSPALVLRFALLSERGIRAVFEKDVRAFLVI